MTPAQRAFCKQMIEEHEAAIRDHTKELERYQRMWRACTGSDFPIQKLGT